MSEVKNLESYYLITFFIAKITAFLKFILSCIKQKVDRILIF